MNKKYQGLPVAMVMESEEMNAFAKKHPRLFKRYKAERRECDVHWSGSRAQRTIQQQLSEKDPAKQAELRKQAEADRARFDELTLLMRGRKP